ncbi:hypothetical protein EIP91_004222 [Steccherinum ochraceum]|uniref:Uncharacterized protein n=1 Tax=Steccherinum ochraceum TaxID=92696 RepID=A0A4R0RCC3_9APHY|nr:hypothetical protein EIP91_004222 [Steccherinum ochraceum]
MSLSTTHNTDGYLNEAPLHSRLMFLGCGVGELVSFFLFLVFLWNPDVSWPLLVFFISVILPPILVSQMPNPEWDGPVLVFYSCYNMLLLAISMFVYTGHIDCYLSTSTSHVSGHCAPFLNQTAQAVFNGTTQVISNGTSPSALNQTSQPVLNETSQAVHISPLAAPPTTIARVVSLIVLTLSYFSLWIIATGLFRRYLDLCGVSDAHAGQFTSLYTSWRSSLRWIWQPLETELDPMKAEGVRDTVWEAVPAENTPTATVASHRTPAITVTHSDSNNRPRSGVEGPRYERGDAQHPREERQAPREETHSIAMEEHLRRDEVYSSGRSPSPLGSRAHARGPSPAPPPPPSKSPRMPPPYTSTIAASSAQSQDASDNEGGSTSPPVCDAV